MEKKAGFISGCIGIMERKNLKYLPMLEEQLEKNMAAEIETSVKGLNSSWGYTEVYRIEDWRMKS